MFVIIRDKRTEKAILGRLFLCGVVIAYTLENASKAIPAGLYSIENSKSTKFKRELPLLYNAAVPAKRGVRIHVGNSYKDSSACVLVGMGRKGDELTESKPAETMVTMLCRNVKKLVITEN
jgi:hypothetical protein